MTAHRSRAVTDLAHEMPCMFTDLPHVCTWPRTPCVPCHGNWQVLGRGFAFKTDDNLFAAGCTEAHDLVDGRRSVMPRDTAFFEWLRAHVKTWRWIWENDKVRVV